MWSAKLHLMAKLLSHIGHLHPFSGSADSIGDGVSLFSPLSRGSAVLLWASQGRVSDEGIESDISDIGEGWEE